MHLSKGQLIDVEGRLQTRQWDDDAGVRLLSSLTLNYWSYHRRSLYAGFDHAGLKIMQATSAPRAQTECQLISAGCTTGWNDWIHGELWLCPDGLLRRRLGFIATVRHGVGPTVDLEARPRRSFSTADILDILSANRRNYWLPWTAIEQATLSYAPAATQLRLRLTGGRAVRLLWVLFDNNERVAQSLAEKLGERFARR